MTDQFYEYGSKEYIDNLEKYANCALKALATFADKEYPTMDTDSLHKYMCVETYDVFEYQRDELTIRLEVAHELDVVYIDVFTEGNHTASEAVYID